MKVRRKIMVNQSYLLPILDIRNPNTAMTGNTAINTVLAKPLTPRLFTAYIMAASRKTSITRITIKAVIG